MKITLEDMKRQNGELIDQPQEPAPKPEEPVTFKGEAKKLKELHGKERIAYLWDYYRIPTLVIIVIIIAAVSLVHAIQNQPNYCFGGALLNITSADFTSDTTYLDNYMDYAGIDSDKYSLNIKTGLYLSDDTSSNYNTYMALAALVSAQDIDFIICDKDIIEYLATTGYAGDLESMLSSDTFAKYENLMLNSTIGSDEDSVPNRPVAIKMNDSHLTKGMNIINENYYIIFVPNARHPELFSTFLDYLLEQ